MQKTEAPSNIIALDIGEKRIGIAQADTDTKLPAPMTTIEVDGLEEERIREIVAEFEIDLIVVGLPRNQQGEETTQSQLIREFAHQKLSSLGVKVKFQDESLTSVMAEQHLSKSKKLFSKGQVDMYAAAIILGDYLESHYGHQASL